MVPCVCGRSALGVADCPPVPSGVLRADVSWFNRPVPPPEVSLQELIRDVVEGGTAGDASDALLGAVQRGYNAGLMVRFPELLETSGQFAGALETVRGRQIAARLSALGRQIEFPTREVEEAARRRTGCWRASRVQATGRCTDASITRRPPLD